MEKKVRVFNKKDLEKVKRRCDELNKDFKVVSEDEVVIIGDDLEGIIDEIKMNRLGEIID